MATLTVWRYDTPLGAGAAEVRLRAVQDRGALTVHDAVTVAWMPGAHQPRVGHLRHTTPGAVAKRSVLGGLVGVLVLAPLTGAAAVARIEVIAQRLKGTGIDRAFLDDIVSHLVPGTSALLVLSSDVDLDVVRPMIERGLARGDVVLLHAELEDAAPAVIRDLVRDLGPPSTED